MQMYTMYEFRQAISKDHVNGDVLHLMFLCHSFLYKDFQSKKITEKQLTNLYPSLFHGECVYGYFYALIYKSRYT